MNSAVTTSNPLREGLARLRVPPPCAMVIFGASGDLTRQKLIPALFGLYQKHLLPPSFHLIGISRSELSTGEFRDNLKRSILDKAPDVSDNLWNGFAKNIEYQSGGYDDPQTFAKLGVLLDAADGEKGTAGNRVFYLSTPPSVFAPIITNLGNAGLQKEAKGFSRIVVEKPFGHDLASAQNLNRIIREVFQEKQIYRIDHYLGKETVQNLLVMRFGNGIFEPIWNRRYVDHVQITAAEDQGIGSRAGYYEKSGVVRDMFQNHLFQVMCLVAMEPPISLEADTIRDEKLKILRAIQPFSEETVKTRAIRGQYGPGMTAGEETTGYRDEPHVGKESTTPTFAAIKFFLETWRWQGVPFLLRSGKRLPKRATEVAIFFKEPPHLLFKNSSVDLNPNVLVIRIQPDEGITMRFEAKVPGMHMEIRPVNMDFSYGTSFVQNTPDAYERLILDCMLGDATLFIRSDETEAAWRALMPILEAWDNNPPDEPFPNYEAGTWGPAAADSILGKQPRRKWRRL